MQKHTPNAIQVYHEQACMSRRITITVASKSTHCSLLTQFIIEHEVHQHVWETFSILTGYFVPENFI